MKKRHKKLKRVILGLIGAVFAIYVIAGAIWLISLHGGHKSPVPAQASARTVPAPLQQDPGLVADARQLGISADSLNLIKDPGLQTKGESGLFTAPITIKISPSSDNELETLAHEYMHYHWSALTPAQRQPIADQLLNFYETDRGFHAYFDGLHYDPAYISQPDNLVNELDSVECAQVKPYLLPAPINEYCNSVVPNRTIVF